jgi:hypothetical protein
MDAFDKVFAGKNVKASIRRKLDDDTTRTAKLADGAVPAELSLDAFAEAAMKGATLGKRALDRGAALSMSVGVSGAAARSAVLAMGDAAEEKPARKPKATETAAA